MNKIYLASPFFNDEQNKRIDDITNLFSSKINIDLFSPRDDGIKINKSSTLKERENAFKDNIKKIEECDLLFAIIDDDDPGTLFEIGYAFSCKIPICLFCFNKKEKLNLMLSESFTIFINGNWQLLKKIVSGWFDSNLLKSKFYLLDREIMVFDGQVE